MADVVRAHDFIELEYTGALENGTVFDTTSESRAKDHHLPTEKKTFGPVTICVGEQQLLPGLDAGLEGKEVGKEYTITLPPEHAFGKRDIKRLKIIPSNTFREHKMDPYPGLQIEVDGEMGTVSRISGGRIIVNFNHPLAGKMVMYSFKILRKIIAVPEKIKAYLMATLSIPKEKINVVVQDQKAVVELRLPTALPAPLTEALGKKITELTGLQEVTFSSTATEK